MAPDAHAVAHAALDGPWALEALVTRLAARGGWRDAEEIGEVAARLITRWSRRRRTAPARFVAEVAAVLAGRPGIHRVLADPPVRPWRWPVEPWVDLGALALGLDLRPGELDWFADRGGWLRRTPDGPLHHYRRRWVLSRSGSPRRLEAPPPGQLPTCDSSPRLLESPGPRLQEIQRRIGRRVLARIPVHDAAHGYVRGRSPVTLAAKHAGRAMVVRVDLEGFFSHVTGERVAGLLRAAGYPPAVAAAIAGLLVTATPVAVLRTAPGAASESRRRLLDRLAGPHVPQGAPASPAVANLLAHRLDRRVAGLAAAVGAEYTRYADDLVLSGHATLPARGLVDRITGIAAEEGFRVRADKTRVMPAHHRQRITGWWSTTGPRPPVATTTPSALCCTTVPEPARTRRTVRDIRRSATI